MPPNPKPPAAMTQAQGIALASETLRIIKAEPDPKHFHSSVQLGLIGLRARLQDGAFFTAGMQQTLENWSKAIGPGMPPGDEEVVQ